MLIKDAATEPMLDIQAFTQGTGWAIKPEGACKGDVCIPLTADAVAGEQINVRQVADTMGLPLVGSPEHGLWVLGPEAIGSRALTSADAPPLVLPDVDGKPFDLASLRGQKVLVYAWAPY